MYLLIRNWRFKSPTKDLDIVNVEIESESTPESEIQWDLGREEIRWEQERDWDRERVRFSEIYILFGWRGEGGGVKGSKVVLAKNKLILC